MGSSWSASAAVCVLSLAACDELQLAGGKQVVWVFFFFFLPPPLLP